MFSILGWGGPIIHICHLWCSAPYHCVLVALVCKQMRVLFLVAVSGRQCHLICHSSEYLMFDFPWFQQLRPEAFFLTRCPCPQSGPLAHTGCWRGVNCQSGLMRESCSLMDPSNLANHIKGWTLRWKLLVPPGRVGLKGEALWSYGMKPSRWKFFLSKVARSVCGGRHNICHSLTLRFLAP